MLMTFRKHMPTIYIHPILLMFVAIAFLTGTISELIIILSIILIHELGHYTVAHIFKWRIKYIMLWVFGGVMHTDEHGNKSMLEEALVTVAGPFQHLIIYGITYFLAQGDLIPVSLIELIYFYNTVILLFNLLPIWPLDGGKFLFICLLCLFPYRPAYHMIIMSSIIVCLTFLCLQLFVFPFTLSAFLITCFLLFENINEWRHRFYVFMRFLLKRYEKDKIKKQKKSLIIPADYTLIDVFSLFRQTKKHTIYVSLPNGMQKKVSEYDCLRYYFHDKQPRQSIGELLQLK